MFSRVQLFVTPWTVNTQAPLSMRFSRQEDWSGVPFPSPEDLPNPGSEARSPALQTDSLPSELPGKPSGEYKKGLSLSIGDMINEMSLIQSMCLVTQSWPALCDPMDCSLPGSSVHGDSPGKNTGGGYSMPYCRGSSQPRDRTQISRTAGRFFTS